MTPKAIQERHICRRGFLLRLYASLHVPLDDREDLAQQSLLKFLSRGYAEMNLNEKSENALLARIGYSTFIDSCRKKRDHNMGAREVDVVDQSDHRRREQIIAETRELIARANLTRDQLELIETKFGDGKSLATISRESGLHVNTIRRRLAKTLEQIKRQARLQEMRAQLGRADL